MTNSQVPKYRGPKTRFLGTSLSLSVSWQKLQMSPVGLPSHQEGKTPGSYIGLEKEFKGLSTVLRQEIQDTPVKCMDPLLGMLRNVQ